jgi:regulator of protease activity HflC (stomatin/prohibitin superfamily)
MRFVTAETTRTNEIQKATKEQQVQVIAAERDLEVARKDLETAEKQSQAIISIGQGDADVISYTRTAEANALRSMVAPFGSGEAYARYLYLKKIAPNIDSILSNTDGPLAQPLRELSQPPKGSGK